MNLLRLVARPLLAAPFVLDAVSALTRPQDHVERARAVRPLLDRIPGFEDLDDSTLRLATRLAGGATLVAALAFATGRAARTSATVLAAAALPIALVNHPVWAATDKEERVEQAKGLLLRGALVGAMTIAAVDRQGRPSAQWRYGAWRVHRGQLDQLRSQERQAAALRAAKVEEAHARALEKAASRALGQARLEGGVERVLAPAAQVGRR
ncbi:DoxX family membrane protein [Schaalia sp. 19OD2882]|uniref:DoxX family membrane protein n=1 Tax=Schaalia sp. 19OD2882 TaxID=2794089 RepID=UPI001C1EE8A4|nr:DoxX family membrane protein [Schaalia sp. 19OD2882]QWW20323.1 DoxX family membrane protein [Schaalia sp. 19OD2882]